MRIFLDECVDWRLRREIADHDVSTARDMGWTTIENGALLSLASEHFDVFITVDRNLSFQQNLSLWPIAVVVLQARSNRLADLLPLVPDLLLAIESAMPGKATLVGAPSSFESP